MGKLEELKARLRLLESKFHEFDTSSSTYHEMYDEIQDLKKKISQGERLEEDLKSLKNNRDSYMSNDRTWLAIQKEIILVKKEINKIGSEEKEKVKSEIKEIERHDKLEDLKKQLEYFQRTKDIFEKRAKVKGEKIQKVKSEIKYLQDEKKLLEHLFSEPIKIAPKKKSGWAELHEAINSGNFMLGAYFKTPDIDVSDWEKAFGVAAGGFADKPKYLNTFKHHIVTSKDDPEPRKINVTDRTNKTIVFDEEITGKRSGRMFISDFFKNYTIHESFD